jgi:hypothetical protein
MTQTLPVSGPVVRKRTPQFYRWCLRASLTISSMGVIGSVIVWWLVRLDNLEAVESGTRIHDLVIASADSSSLPLLMFVMACVGSTALILALISAKGAPPTRPWLLVVAGMLATSLLMVPVVVVANAWVVTTGVRLLS